MLPLLLGFSLTTCGKDSKDSPATDPKTTPAEAPKDSPAAAPNATIASSLAGTWKTSCIAKKINTSTVANNTQKDVAVFYSDFSCSSPYYTATRENTFTIEGAVSGLTNTYKKNNTLTSFKLMMRSSDAVTDANTEAFFGYTDWVKDVDKDISGKKSAPSEEAELGVGSVVYTIVKVQDNKWYGGDMSTNDGLSEAKRPTTVDSADFSTKQ